MPPYGLMRAEWQTPLYHVSYAAVKPDYQAASARVAQQVLQHYETLLAENKGQLVHNAWSPNGANQVRQTRLAFSSFHSPGLPPWL